MRIGTLILCRYSSTRLPGKIMRHLGDKPILLHLYEKLKLVVPADTIVVTTSLDSGDDIIEEYCIKNDIQVFRGSLPNVAERFLAAAKSYDFDFVSRINGDAPFLCMPQYANMLVACRTNQYDLISNVQGRTWPRGMSLEVVRVSLYEELQKVIQTDKFYYEHVTSYFYAYPDVGRRYDMINARYPELKDLHLAVDEMKDYEFAQRMYDVLGDRFYHATLEDYCTALLRLRADYEAQGLEWKHSFDRKKLMHETKQKGR